MAKDRLSCGKMIELFVALTITLWGLWVVFPFWDTFSSSPVFTALKLIAPEVVWGASAAVLGIAELIFVHRGFFRIRQVIAVVNTFFFALLTVLYGFGSIEATAVVSYAIFGFMSLYSYIMLTFVLMKEKENER